MEDKQKHFKGTVVRCVYSSPDFKTYAIDVRKEDYPDIKHNKFNNVSLIGDISDLIDGIEYDIIATEENTKYGVSYRVVNIRRDIPMGIENTRVFLEEIINHNQADVLLDAYPDIVDIVMSGNTDVVDLSKLHGIKEKTFDRIKTKIIENFKLADLVGEFKGVLSISMLKRIYDRYSDIDVLRARLREEPYTTLTNISGVGFKTADAIIIKLQKENIVDFGYDVKTSKDRCYACIIHILQENEDDGHTKMNLSDLRGQCIKMIPSCVNFFAEAIKSDDIYYDKSDMSVGLMKTYETEKYIAETIGANIKTTDVWDFDVEKYRNVGKFELSDEQMNAPKNLCKYGVSILNGAGGCVDCDTEFFDGTGWRPISEYKDGDMVLQYNEDGTAELVLPDEYHKKECNYMWHFKTKYGINQCLSEEHRVVYQTSRGNLKIMPFKDVMAKHNDTGFRGKFYTSFNYCGSGIDLSDDEIRLMVATFADGSFRTEDCYKESNNARFHLKKQRKKDRLQQLALSTNSCIKSSDSSADGYTDFYINVPFRSKHFPSEWYNCNKHQLEVIADEVMLWDGNFKEHNRYYTTHKIDADFVQFVYSSLGYRSTIYKHDRSGDEYVADDKVYYRKSVEYVVSYTKRNMIGLNVDHRKKDKMTKINKYKTKDGYKYCFTMPSSMWVARRGDCIFVTGNTGKTQSTLAVINMLKENHKDFLLLSPTGKAAKVLSGYTGERACTIHRGLWYNPKTGWGFNKKQKLPYDVVIVDETSMCDIQLFKHLIDAIDFERTRLLLVGDNAQLPSVGCGNLLHDFMESGVIPTSTLTKVFRYADGGLSKIATDTRYCKPYLNKTMKNKMTQFGINNDYTFVDIDSNNIPIVSVKLYKKLIDSGNKPEDVQILAAKNVGDCGTVVLNNMIQKAINSNYGKDRFMKYGDVLFYDDDLVIQTKNNYRAPMCNDNHEIIYENNSVATAMVANGETGVIKYACKDYAVIDFDGILVMYNKPMMITVKLGYAITIHKSQGSSIKNVILCTPKSHMFMLNSNILYTGITRTTDKCYHLGSVSVVNTAVKKKANLTRHTFLKDLLCSVCDKSS